MVKLGYAFINIHWEYFNLIFMDFVTIHLSLKIMNKLQINDP